MRKVVLIIACALALCACSQEKDPFKEALSAALEEKLGEPAKKITYMKFERIDTTDIGRELSMRLASFKLKYSQEKSFYDKYTAENKPKNAQKYYNAARNTLDILAKLDDLYLEFMEDGRLYEPASYDYRFCVVIEGENAQLNLEDSYACITPDYQVVGLNSHKKGLHKTTGASVPGYLGIIKGYEEIDASEVSE